MKMKCSALKPHRAERLRGVFCMADAMFDKSNIANGTIKYQNPNPRWHMRCAQLSIDFRICLQAVNRWPASSIGDLDFGI